ncbi:MAG TPA: septum formation initiator family protein, partial [Candidatus Omnitrophota bacterium]|nr:septum formation initiator family protein [Candidatus Omnitrophota bacterium]
MLKKFFIFLAVLLAVALILCWIYLPSVTRYRELRSEEERLKQKIREIDQQIKVLADERNLLQTDVAYLEKVIREELGFVKPGEIIYELVTKTDA